MEKFAVDLDRVLDEFELNEDLALEPADGKECGILNYEPPICRRDSYGHDDVRISQTSALNLHFPENVDNFLDLSEADFAPIKPTTVAIVHKPTPEINNGLKDHELIGLTSEERKLPFAPVSTVAAAMPHTLENGTNIVSGIKVLHCDETINKDYLLTFGRKWEAPTVNRHSVPQKLADEDDSTPSAPVHFENAVQVASLLNEEIQDEGISMEENDIETFHHIENQHSSILGVDGTVSPCNNGASEDTSEETFVTPEHNNLPYMDVVADKPLIGFGEDIEITEEEIQQYLEEKDIAASASTADGNHLRSEREEFFTPMIEDPVKLSTDEGVCDETGHSELHALGNGECDEEMKAKVNAMADNVANSDLLLLELNNDSCIDKAGAREHETDQTKEKTYHSKMSGVEHISNDVACREVQSHQDVGINKEILEQCLSKPLKSEKVKECKSRSKKLKEEHLLQVDDSVMIAEVLRDDNAEVSSPASIDDGYDANLYLNEQSPYDGTVSSGAYDELSDGQLRLQRPTSLHLPGKIEVTPPPNALVQEMIDAERNKSFASLMATAGSPDAGLGISPASSDEPETPSYADSPQLVLSEEERHLGKVAPVWVPDAEAPNCMQCDAKFTVIKRRHHCRACGKVLCAQCCGLKAKLHYMENKEARVCQFCLEIMEKVLLLEQTSGGVAGAAGSTGSVGTADAWRPPQSSQNRTPNPNNPSEYCSVIPPLQQCLANANAPPPTVMVPVGVLKRGGDGRPRGEPKQVMFSDGIRPGGDLTELDGPEPKLPFRRQGRLLKKVERPQGQMPTVSDLCRSSPEKREYSLNDDLDMEHLLTLLKDDATEPLIFVLIKNLRVIVNILNLDCCVHRTCWSFTTCGMVAVGQDEIVILLEVLPDEKAIPYDVFYHLIDIYDDAGKGITVSGMGHTVFTRSCLGSRDHGGFLFIHPTFQCLQKIPLPPSPYLFGILLQKWEIPWAKVFPLRLLLRLGHEFRYYPSPLVGIRFRKPVFCEIGHTIVNLLADFRNYQYSLPSVPGLVIHMKDKQTYICCPRNRYDEMVKALNSSIDHVLALAATFSSEADSHLVCVQNEDGNYQTQAINIKDKPRKVTGASFVVFNGALKSSSGLTAKSSIVEDGLMVQISGDSMIALRQALRDMRDYVVPCGPIGAESAEEVVHVIWVDDDRNVNIGVKSPIDGMAMDGIPSIRIHCGTDYVGDGHLIRWTEVYLIRTDDGVGSRRSDPVDVSKVSDTLAQAGCVALAQHLSNLYSTGLTKIGLRVTLDSDNVGYEIGAGGQRLPADYMNDLDSELVPAMHCAASPNQEGSVLLELIFHIIQQ